jgi:hypothetical protein
MTDTKVSAIPSSNCFEADVVPGVERADKQEKKRSGYGLRYCTTMAPAALAFLLSLSSQI